MINCLFFIFLSRYHGVPFVYNKDNGNMSFKHSESYLLTYDERPTAVVMPTNQEGMPTNAAPEPLNTQLAYFPAWSDNDRRYIETAMEATASTMIQYNRPLWLLVLLAAADQPKGDVQSAGILKYNQTWFHRHIWDTNARFGVVDMTGVIGMPEIPIEFHQIFMEYRLWLFPYFKTTFDGIELLKRFTSNSKPKQLLSIVFYYRYLKTAVNDKSMTNKPTEEGIYFFIFFLSPTTTLLKTNYYLLF